MSDNWSWSFEVKGAKAALVVGLLLALVAKAISVFVVSLWGCIASVGFVPAVEQLMRSLY
jgi:hypothetical protein